MKKPCLIGLLVIAFLSGCKKEEVVTSNFTESVSAEPVLPEQPYEYPVTSSNQHVPALGRVLFYDKNLSLNNSISCANCHQQSKAFCDNQQTSAGFAGVQSARNTPGIFNKKTRAFWDGRARNFSELALMPVANHFEMGVKNFDDLALKLEGLSYYKALVEKAYGDPYIDSARLNNAITEFLENFMFSNNKFRRSKLGTEQLSVTESLGKDLFFGKAGCFQCHNIVIIDPAPFNPYGDPNDESFTAFNIGLDNHYADAGIAAVTGNESDNGKFMIPSILNVEYTYPYMHDGRFKTLEEVVEHYNSGVNDHPCLDFRLREMGEYSKMNVDQAMAALDHNGNGMLEPEEAKQVPPKKLNLTTAEKRQLVEFLKTLSDPGIKSDEMFSSPFP